MGRKTTPILSWSVVWSWWCSLLVAKVACDVLDIRKQRLAVDQSFNKGMEKYTKLEQAHLHQKVDTIKERGTQNEEALMHSKDQGRKVEIQKYA